MKLYRLYKQIHLNINKEQCWEFFSKPENLKRITPEYMNFEILRGGGTDMYSGQIIEYKVNALPGLRLNWVTEITHVKEFEFFVDEQRFGPYSFWHHKHFFKETPDGMDCVDELHYLPPMGPLGRLMNALIIKKKLDEIFNYRQSKLTEIFES